MKQLIQSVLVLALLSSCSAPLAMMGYHYADNPESIPTLKAGMTRTEVNSLFGSRWGEGFVQIMQDGNVYSQDSYVFSNKQFLYCTFHFGKDVAEAKSDSGGRLVGASTYQKGVRTSLFRENENIPVQGF